MPNKGPNDTPMPVDLPREIYLARVENRRRREHDAHMQERLRQRQEALRRARLMQSSRGRDVLRANPTTGPVPRPRYPNARPIANGYHPSTRRVQPGDSAFVESDEARWRWEEATGVDYRTGRPIERKCGGRVKRGTRTKRSR